MDQLLSQKEVLLDLENELLPVNIRFGEKVTRNFCFESDFSFEIFHFLKSFADDYFIIFILLTCFSGIFPEKYMRFFFPDDEVCPDFFFLLNV